MKIRIYPADYSKNLSEMAWVGHDKSGYGFYMIDVAHIMPHEEIDRESLQNIAWNNVDLIKEKRDETKS